MSHSSVGRTFVLSSGVKIPSVGLGVFLTKPGFECFNAVTSALRLGYRHIDTARLYRNEADVGEALKQSGLPREDVFLTTKLWLDDFGYQNAQKAISQSMNALSTSMVDLMLLHAPGDPQTREETWRALEDAHYEGKLTSIGVSNFGVGHLKKLLKTARVKPAVNQIELTPFLQRRKLVDYCRSEGIALEAYSPLGKGSREILDNRTVTKIAQKHAVSNAQLDSLDRNLVTAWDPTTDPV
ncbi:hypothetical protein WJX75_006857 [Coccomyxa subellipsoidea]|uniref:NADP-dependent oxidoreductase domain-containing protein n=1 Tax=Coccomyxa subellipsoidea TaxID=248742 RepID=A0ABR2YJK9_9CHLO